MKQRTGIPTPLTSLMLVVRGLVVVATLTVRPMRVLSTPTTIVVRLFPATGFACL